MDVQARKSARVISHLDAYVMDSRVLWVCAYMREYAARGHRMHRCTYVRTGRAGRSAAAGTHSCRSGSVYAHKYSARRHTGTIFVEYGSMFPGARLCMHAYASKHTDICVRDIHMHTNTREPTDEPSLLGIKCKHHAMH